VATRPSEDVPATAREWPHFPSHTVRFHDVHKSQPRSIHFAVDTDETPVHTDTYTDSRTEHVPADLFRTGTIRRIYILTRSVKPPRTLNATGLELPCRRKKTTKGLTRPFLHPLSPNIDTLRKAKLHINGLSCPTRQDMLDALFCLHDIDILLIQEVTSPFTLGF
jgi:hypothetical protein